MSALWNTGGDDGDGLQGKVREGVEGSRRSKQWRMRSWYDSGMAAVDVLADNLQVDRMGALCTFLEWRCFFRGNKTGVMEQLDSIGHERVEPFR